MFEATCQAQPKCGEIWMCDLSGRRDNIQAGYRPVFIVSNDRNNIHSPTVNVIPLTSKMGKRNLPVHVTLGNYLCYGLKKPSTMLVEQITTVQRDNLSMRIGEIIDVDTLMRIRQAIEIQLPIVGISDSH